MNQENRNDAKAEADTSTPSGRRECVEQHERQNSAACRACHAARGDDHGDDRTRLEQSLTTSRTYAGRGLNPAGRTRGTPAILESHDGIPWTHAVPQGRQRRLCSQVTDTKARYDHKFTAERR